MKHFAIITAISAVFLFLARSHIDAGPFDYDEADYMFAAECGFLANYLDSPSYSFPEFVRAGTTRGSNPGLKSSLSKSVRGSGDLFLYRHAHGPVFFYWLRVLSGWSTSEYFIRAFSPVFPLLAGIAIYLGCLWILPAPQGTIAAILGCTLYLWNPAVIFAGEVAPHHLFGLWFTLTLLLLAKLLATGARPFWYAALGTTALAFCTLEVAFVLVAVVGVCGYLERRRLEMTWRRALASLSLFALAVLVVHPANLTRLAFLKSYLFFAYLSIRRQAAWGNVTFLDTWIYRFRLAPLEWILIVAALVIFWRYRHLAGRRQALPFLLFGMAMLATMLRVLALRPRYVLPFLPPLLVFAAIVLSGLLVRWKPAIRALVVAAVCAVVLFHTALYSRAHPLVPDRDAPLLLAGIRQSNLQSSRLLVPHDAVPVLHYYFPRAELTGYVDESALPSGRFDAIVRMTSPVRIERCVNPR